MQKKKSRSQQGKSCLTLTHSLSIILVSKHPATDFHVFQSIPGPKVWVWGGGRKIDSEPQKESKKCLWLFQSLSKHSLQFEICRALCPALGLQTGCGATPLHPQEPTGPRPDITQVKVSWQQLGGNGEEPQQSSFQAGPSKWWAGQSFKDFPPLIEGTRESDPGEKRSSTQTELLRQDSWKKRWGNLNRDK